MAPPAGAPTLTLRKFDPRSMPDNASCVIVAQSQGGKTTLGIDLMYHKRHLPAWYLFSTTEGCSKRLSQIIPPLYLKTSFDLDKLAKVFAHQQSKIQRYSRPRSEAERRKVPDDELPKHERYFKDPGVGGYFEDCFDDKSVLKKPIVQSLYKNGRHREMFSIMPCQYIIDLDVSMRNQVKYWFLLREDSEDTRRKLFKHIGGAFKSWKIFNKMMTECTNNYHCLVIDNLSKSPHLEDRVFWYKAELHGAFRVGCARYWRFHKLNYDDKKDTVDPIEAEAKRKLKQARLRRRRGGKHRLAPPTSQPNAIGVGNALRPVHQSMETPSMMEAREYGQNALQRILQNDRGRCQEPQFYIRMQQ